MRSEDFTPNFKPSETCSPNIESILLIGINANARELQKLYSRISEVQNNISALSQMWINSHKNTR